jgi:hypothetical protein
MLRYYEVVEKVRLVLVSCMGLLLLPGTPSQMVFVLLVNIASAVLALKTQVPAAKRAACDWLLRDALVCECVVI